MWLLNKKEKWNDINIDICMWKAGCYIINSYMYIGNWSLHSV
jgi:hypothetical protein